MIEPQGVNLWLNTLEQLLCRIGMTAVRGLLPLYPLHSFGCQVVKRLNGQRNMVFLSVLDFVVADSPKGLHEQHHGRYPGPSDLGSVVQWTRWHSIRRTRHFLDDLLTQLNYAGWKGTGSMFQMRDHSTVQSLPRQSAHLLRALPSAGFSVLLHPGHVGRASFHSARQRP